MDSSLVSGRSRATRRHSRASPSPSGDRLHAVAHRILRDIDLAEDATQQALLAIWRDLPQLRDPARFEAWSYRLLVRACYSRGTPDSQPGVRAPRLVVLEPPDSTDALSTVARSRPARARLPATFHRPSRGRGAAPLPRPVHRRDRRDARRSRRDGPIPTSSRDARAARGARCRRTADHRGRSRNEHRTRRWTRIVRSWLEQGVTTLPDRVLDAVLDQLPATPQRRPAWPARRIADMNPIAKFAIATAAVVAIAIVGLNLFGGQGTSEFGGVPPTPNASTSPPVAPAGSPAPIAPTSEHIDPGRYRWTSPDGEVTFVLPDGWTGTDWGIVKNQETPTHLELAHYMPGSPDQVTHVYADACKSEGRLEPVDPLDGNSNLMSAALENQAGTDAATSWFNGPDGVTDPPVGQKVEIREEPGLDRSTCRDGAAGSAPDLGGSGGNDLLRPRTRPLGAATSSARTARRSCSLPISDRTQPRRTQTRSTRSSSHSSSRHAEQARPDDATKRAGPWRPARASMSRRGT